MPKNHKMSTRASAGKVVGGAAVLQGKTRLRRKAYVPSTWACDLQPRNIGMSTLRRNV